MWIERKIFLVIYFDISIEKNYESLGRVVWYCVVSILFK